MRAFLSMLTGLMVTGFCFTAVAEDQVIVLRIKDHKFIPQTIEVPAGQKFVLEVKNEGPGSEEFESTELNREKIIREGKSAKVLLGPLQAGEYKFFGEFNPDTAQGKIIAK